MTTTEVPVEVLPPEAPLVNGEGSRPPARRRFTKKKLALAFAIAALSDGLSFALTFTPPLAWALDLLTAILLFLALGRQWILLPGLILEAIPGVYVFPFWVLVVGSVAVWGKVKKSLKE